MQFLTNSRNFLLILFILGIFNWIGIAQTFQKVTDPNNPVVTTITDAGYSGAAWVDIDNDGDEDLFTTKNFLFRNNGNGNFERVTNFHQLSANQLGNGTSWADFDNDGDIDLFLSGNPSLVYKNDGSGNLEAITESPIGTADDNRGWTGAWADYDNDGFVDLLIVHPNGFLGSPGIPCRFFRNNGDGRFTQINSFAFTTLLEPYTVGTWSDYDLDGDIDLFIGSGPVNHTAPDFLFKNTLMQSGTPDLIRINTAPFGTDPQNGQVWNWIDYDNDGDLDAMLTNYGLVPNRFYKNNNGSYQSITNGLTITGNFLGNSWEDIDNDGDLDVILTSESSAQVFINDGNGIFTLESSFAGAARSSSLADYDNDGDVDLYVSGTGNVRGLYENISSNGNKWVMFNLKGTISNKSAIGTKVRLKAIINGNNVWQLREVSAQNNFNGMNCSRLHFGLGNASSIDSVIIDYPSGKRKVLTNLAVNNIYTDEEEIPSGFLRANFRADSIKGEGQLTVHFSDLTLADPLNTVTYWEWDFNNDGTIDATDQNPAFTYTQIGNYSVKLIVSNGSAVDTLIRENYISVNPVTGVEGELNQVPEEFRLYQNYPNPFNPSTIIKYSVPEETFVNLKVYNVLGTEVTTLVNDKKTPGLYELNFGGENLPSGIYVYRIKAGSFTASKKMLLLK